MEHVVFVITVITGSLFLFPFQWHAALTNHLHMFEQKCSKEVDQQYDTHRKLYAYQDWLVWAAKALGALKKRNKSQ